MINLLLIILLSLLIISAIITYLAGQVRQTPSGPHKQAAFNHPFYDYLLQGVPVALSTDDQGILLTNLSHEYYKASTRYPITYQQLKSIDRNSVAYSFLPGQQLWAISYHGDPSWNYTKFVPPCQQDNPYTKVIPSASCQQYLNDNLKAQLEWRLETQFANFEKIVNNDY